MFFLVILFQLLSIAGQVFTNIWLSAWSDDANDETTATAQQSRKRLMVYGILASITGKIQQLLYICDTVLFLFQTEPTESIYFFGTYLTLLFTTLFYTLLTVLCVGMVTFGIAIGSTIASKKLFEQLLECLLRAPMSFYDTTPMGRILNR